MYSFTNNLRYTCTQELEINFCLSNIDHYIYDYDLINRYIAMIIQLLVNIIHIL